MSGSKNERDLFQLQSIDKSTLSSQVVERIISLLTSGQLQPGDKLPTELELIELMEVSRPVLREALASLETLGIITRKNRRGTFFNSKVDAHPFSIMLSLSKNDLKSLVEGRMALELGLVSIAAEKISEHDLERLKVTIDRIADNVDGDYGHYDIEFHKIIAESANNPIVEGLITSLLIAHHKIDKQFKIRDKKRTVEEHTKIYEALAKRDPNEAFSSMYEHLTGVRVRITNN